MPHEGRLFAIEVKSGRVRPLHGMEKFVKSHSSAVPLLVGTGGIPLEEFLSKTADRMVHDLNSRQQPPEGPPSLSPV